MEPQKLLGDSALDCGKAPPLQQENVKPRTIVPYSLYLMNNNWHTELQPSQCECSYADYFCGMVWGIILFLGLAATEPIGRYKGEPAVAIYLICFLVLYFALVTRFYIARQRM